MLGNETILTFAITEVINAGVELSKTYPPFFVFCALLGLGALVSAIIQKSAQMFFIIIYILIIPILIILSLLNKKKRKERIKELGEFVAKIKNKRKVKKNG